MGETGSQDDRGRNPAGAAAGEGHPDPGVQRDAPAPGPPRSAAPRGRPARRRNVAATLLGAIGATVVSLVFIVSFIGALHSPGPRSVPIGIAGPPAGASALGSALDRQAPGGYVVTSYPTEAAARSAISGRDIDAAVITGARVPLLLVATAVGEAVTDAAIKDVHAAARAAGLNLAVRNIRPLPASDPEGISQVFFVTALLAPSLVFANLLVNRFGKGLHPVGQVAAAAVYAAIVAAVATAFADPVIGALTGAPWGLFGIGTLLAFAAAVTAAAAARWAGGLGYLVIFLLFIPVGIASSGTTLGPDMITPWYADLGKALPAGSALPAVQNTVYFNGSDITTPLLILSAWAVAGALSLALVAIFRPPLPGQRAQRRGQPAATAPG